MGYLFCPASLTAATTTVDIYATMGDNGGHAVNFYEEAYDGGVLVGSTLFTPTPPFSNVYINTAFSQPVGRVLKVRINDVYSTPNGYYLTPVGGVTYASGSPFVASFTGGVTTNYSAVLCVKNQDIGIKTYVVYNGTSPAIRHGEFGTKVLGPGQTGCWTITSSTTNGWYAAEELVFYNGDGSEPYTNIFAVAGPTGWSNVGAPSTNTAGAYNPQPAIYNTTNSPITFNSTNTVPANNGTLQTGFNAIFDATAKSGDKLDQIERDVAPLHSDLLGLSNQFTVLTNRSSLTNFSAFGSALADASNSAGPITAQFAGLSNAAYAEISGNLVAMEEQAASGASNLNATTFSRGSLSPWTVTFGMGGTATAINLDPLQSQDAQDLAAWIHGILVWLITLMFLAWSTGVVVDLMRDGEKLPQAKSPSITVFGNSVPYVGSLISAVAITVALGALPTIVTALMTSRFGSISALTNSHPFTSGNALIAGGVGLLDKFVPVNLLVVSMVNAIAFKLAAGRLLWLASRLIRFVPACIVFFAMVQSACATLHVTVVNGSTNACAAEFYDESNGWRMKIGCAAGRSQQYDLPTYGGTTFGCVLFSDALPGSTIGANIPDGNSVVLIVADSSVYAPAFSLISSASSPVQVFYLGLKTMLGILLVSLFVKLAMRFFSVGPVVGVN